MRFLRLPTAIVRPLSSLAKFSFVISNIRLPPGSGTPWQDTARQRARPVEAQLLRLRLLLLVRFGKARGHSLEVEAVVAIGRILQAGVLELLQQERYALEAIATMAVAAVGEKADHCYRLCGPYGQITPCRAAI